MITNLEQAQSWFLSHSSGSVMVQNSKGEQKEFDNYPDAEEFLNV